MGLDHDNGDPEVAPVFVFGVDEERMQPESPSDQVSFIHCRVSAPHRCLGNRTMVTLQAPSWTFITIKKTQMYSPWCSRPALVSRGRTPRLGLSRWVLFAIESPHLTNFRETGRR